MAINKYTFRWLYSYDFQTTVNYFAKVLTKKVAPAFDDISEEAHEVELEAFERLGHTVTPEWYDPADFADEAHDAGISFYIMADGMRQGVINLFTAGLYHLFEQWFFKFHRRELLSYFEDKDQSLINWAEAKGRLQKDYKINVEGFTSWQKLTELRLVTNTVKHADGTSCDELKTIRPDLFLPPTSDKTAIDIELVKAREVFKPLAGEELYISLEEFAKYVEAVKKFVDELAAAIDTVEYEREEGR